MYFEVPKDYRRNYYKDFVTAITSLTAVVSAIAIMFSLAVCC